MFLYMNMKLIKIVQIYSSCGWNSMRGITAKPHTNFVISLELFFPKQIWSARFPRRYTFPNKSPKHTNQTFNPKFKNFESSTFATIKVQNTHERNRPFARPHPNPENLLWHHPGLVWVAPDETTGRYHSSCGKLPSAGPGIFRVFPGTRSRAASDFPGLYLNMMATFPSRANARQMCRRPRFVFADRRGKCGLLYVEGLWMCYDGLGENFFGDRTCGYQCFE